MNPMSKTQKAKRLYEKLEKDGRIPTAWYTGLIDDHIWVSRKNRAYELEDMSWDHLLNIVRHSFMMSRETPKPVLDEIALRQFSKERPEMYYKKPKWYQWRLRRKYQKILETK